MPFKTNTLAALFPSRGSNMKFQWQDYMVYIFFGLVLVFFALTIGDKGFLTIQNLFNITRTTSMIVVMAVAMTFVICCGELDLSIKIEEFHQTFCADLAGDLAATMAPRSSPGPTSQPASFARPSPPSAASRGRAGGDARYPLPTCARTPNTHDWRMAFADDRRLCE